MNCAPQYEYQVKEEHGIFFDVFRVTPTDGETSLLGSTARVRLGGSDTTFVQLPPGQVLWQVAADGLSANMTIRLLPADVALLRLGSNKWEAAITLSSGEPLEGPSGTVTKKFGLGAVE